MAENEVIFSGDESRLLASIAKIKAEQKLLEKNMRGLAMAAAQGSDTAMRALQVEAQGYAKLQSQMAQAGTELKKLNVVKHQTTMSTGQMSLAMNQAAFAADDFITVLNMPGMGLSAAVRSAGNNITMLASAFGPLATIGTVVGTSILSFALRNREASAETAKTAERVKDLTERLRELSEEAARAKLGTAQAEAAGRRATIRKEIDANRELIEQARQEELGPLFVAAGDTRDPLAREMAAIRESPTAKLERIAAAKHKAALAQANIDELRQKMVREDVAQMAGVMEAEFPGFKHKAPAVEAVGVDFFTGTKQQQAARAAGPMEAAEQELARRQLDLQAATLQAQDPKSPARERISGVEAKQLELMRESVRQQQLIINELKQRQMQRNSGNVVE